MPARQVCHLNCQGSPLSRMSLSKHYGLNATPRMKRLSVKKHPWVPSRSVEMTPRPSASISTSPIHQTDGVCSGSLSPEGSTSTEGDVERGLTLGVSARTIQATELQLSSKDEQPVGSWTPPEYRAKLTYLLKHPLNIPWYSNSMEPGGSAD
jgi:hypothetical protein